MGTSVGIGVGVVHVSGGGVTGAPTGPTISITDITPANARVYESALGVGSDPGVANLVVTGTLSVDYGLPGEAVSDALVVAGTTVLVGGTTVSLDGGDLVFAADSGSGNVRTHTYTYTLDNPVTNINDGIYSVIANVTATDGNADSKQNTFLFYVADDAPVAGFMDVNSAAASPAGNVDDGGRIGFRWWLDDQYKPSADNVERQDYVTGPGPGTGGVRILTQPTEGVAYVSDGTVPHPEGGSYAEGVIVYDAPTDPSQADPPAFEFSYDLVDTDGSVSNVNTVQVVVSASLNSTPNMLAAVPGSGDAQYTELTVTWEYTDATDWADVDRYWLRRKSDSNPSWVTVDSNLPKQAADENGTETYVDTGLDPGETYYYEVWAVDDDPFTTALSLNQAIGVLPNYPTPAAPTLFTATTQSFEQIDLSWTLPTPGTFDTVELDYQEDGAGSWTNIPGIAVDQVAYTHTGLKASTQYNYQIRVINRFSVPSAYANAFDTTGALVGPANLAGVFDGIDKNTLTWDDANYEDRYEIRRRINGGTEITLTTNHPLDDTDYDDQPVSPADYEYTVIAHRTGYASLSDTVTFTATAAKPATPPAPSVVINSPTALDITWTDGAGPVTQVRLERSDDDPTPLTWTEVDTYAPGAGVAGITDSGLTPSTLYHYRVVAINQGVESDPSLHDSETTPSDLFKPVPTTPPPSVSGTLYIGDTVTVDTTGGWNANPAPSSYRYEFKTDGVQVQNGASNTYTILAADANKELTVDVWATNSQGESDTSHTVVIGNTIGAAVPSAGGPVTIAAASGVLVDDVITITADGSPWDAGNPQDMGPLEYEWRRDTVPTGDTGSTYTISAADDGAEITLAITRTNSTGTSTPAVSNGITTAALAAPTFNAPTLDNASPWATQTINVNTLTGINWGNPDNGTTTYQWQRDTAGGTNWSNVGTNSPSYTITGPVGTTVRCLVTLDNGQSTQQATNTATVVIIPVPYYSGGISISQLDGDLLVGSTLRCIEGTWSNSPSYEYRWDNTPDGAGQGLNRDYVIQIGDMGDNLDVTLTRVFNGIGDSPDTPVTATAVTAAGPQDPAGSPTIVERLPGDSSAGAFLDANANSGTWDFGNPPQQQGGYTYNWQWSADDAVWNNYSPVETGTAYQITQDDVDNLYYIRCEVTGTNTNSASTAEPTNSIQTETGATIPGQFVNADWTATDANDGTTPTIDVQVNTLTNGDGGSPITQIDYRLNSGTWEDSLQNSIPATFSITTGLSFGTGVNINIRAVNVEGPANNPGSDTKNRTPTQAIPIYAGDASAVINEATPTVGDTLTVTEGNWSPTADSYTYEWFVDTVSQGAPSALNPTYDTTLLSGGEEVYCHIYGVNTGGTSVSPAQTNTVTVSAAPILTPVYVSGMQIDFTDKLVGSTLTCNEGTWDPAATSYNYQWYRGATPVGLDQRTYDLVEADAGQSMTVHITAAANANGASTDPQLPIISGAEVADPLADPSFSVTLDDLTPADGDTVTAQIIGMDWGNPPGTGTLAYQWQRDTAGGTNWSNISPGGDQATYTIVDANDPAGTTIRCVVTADNTGTGQTIENSNVATVQSAVVGGGARQLLDAWSVGGNGLAIDFTDNTMLINDGGTEGDILATGLVRGGTPAQKYVRNSSGVLELIPNTALPFDHDGSNQPLGILNEPQGKNLQLYSQDQAQWSNYVATHLADQINAPNGLLEGDFIVETNNVGTQQRYRNCDTIDVAQDITVSAYCKQDTGRYFHISVSVLAADALAVTCDTQTGAVNAQGHGASVPTDSGAELVNGWWRVWVTGKINGSAGTAYSYAGLADSLTPTLISFGQVSYLGTGLNIGIWGVQVEQTSYMTSYIPTPAASSVVRDPDWYHWPIDDQTWHPMGGAFSQFMEVAAPDPGANQVFFNNGNSAGQELGIFTAGGFNSWSVATSYLNYGDPGPNVMTKLGMSAATPNADSVRDGAAQNTTAGYSGVWWNSTGGSGIAANEMILGAPYNGIYSVRFHCKALCLVPETRTVQEMETLTT